MLSEHVVCRLDVLWLSGVDLREGVLRGSSEREGEMRVVESGEGSVGVRV